MTTRTSVKDNINRVFTGLHKTVFRATNGKVAGKAFGMPVVMLTTTGRRSGQPRSTMLTSPIHDAAKVVLVASYGGDDRDPAWYRNLTADPAVEIVMSGSRREMTARTASADEKAELWPKVVAAYKGYAGYQTKTERDIPLVILEPAG